MAKGYRKGLEPDPCGQLQAPALPLTVVGQECCLTHGSLVATPGGPQSCCFLAVVCIAVAALLVPCRMVVSSPAFTSSWGYLFSLIPACLPPSSAREGWSWWTDACCSSLCPRAPVVAFLPPLFSPSSLLPVLPGLTSQINCCTRGSLSQESAFAK